MKNRFSQFDETQAGVAVVKHSNRLKLDLIYWPADDDEPANVSCTYEVHGDINITPANEEEAAAFIGNLLQAFRKAERIDTEGGASC